MRPGFDTGGTPSWFDKLTMRATEGFEALILSAVEDGGRDS